MCIRDRAIAGRGTEIAINETNFPDKDFREFLLDKEAKIGRAHV